MVNALLADRIDTRKAGLILYALQTAAGNAKGEFEFLSDKNWYSSYSPEHDAALPEIPEEPPKKSPQSAADANPAPARNAS